jgi:hypothetical protein
MFRDRPCAEQRQSRFRRFAVYSVEAVENDESVSHSLKTPEELNRSLKLRARMNFQKGQNHKLAKKGIKVPSKVIDMQT